MPEEPFGRDADDREADDREAGKDKPLREDIRQVGRILGDVVRAQAGLEVYEIVEGVRRHAVEMRRAEASDGVDHDELAARLKLCGGDISNAARAAAHAATRDDGPVTMAHLVNASARELGKLGRLVRPEELGPLMDLVERPA